uniref:Uncharacterized protein n=1 Tax=Anguilla anguilla TaxID=7936 RepID=A0A0E9RJV5_ANGAN
MPFSKERTRVTLISSCNSVQ